MFAACRPASFRRVTGSGLESRRAIIHEPELLILDEPTHDLDPVQIVEMREMIRSLKESHTVLISSHILPEISQTCDRLLILSKGRVVASGSEAELGQRMLRTRRMVVTVRVDGPAGAATNGTAGASGAGGGPEAVIAAVEGVVRVRRVPAGEPGAAAFQVESETDLRAPVCRAVIKAGYDVVALARAERELERVFVDLVGEAPG